MFIGARVYAERTTQFQLLMHDLYIHVPLDPPDFYSTPRGLEERGKG